MASIYSASIDLSLIDKSKITEKNGKKYYNINVIINDKENEYGQILSITENQTQEERTNKVAKKYLGNGKLVFDSNSKNSTNKEVENKSVTINKNDEDLLPF
jgi:hypothetical protein